MNDTDRALAHKSKTLSWLLRHGANEAGVAMDVAGFASIDDVLAYTKLTRAELDVVVNENNKSRFEVKDVGGRACVRAVQGHSLDGTPVTLDGLEQSWEVVDDDAPVFHGTSVEAARSILVDDGSDDGGIHSAARSHVHLAASADAVVGKRAGVDVLLVIDPAKLRAPPGHEGQRIFRAPNGVLLTRAVPRACVVDVIGQNRAGRAAVDALRRLLPR